MKLPDLDIDRQAGGKVSIKRMPDPLNFVFSIWTRMDSNHIEAAGHRLVALVFLQVQSGSTPDFLLLVGGNGSHG